LIQEDNEKNSIYLSSEATAGHPWCLVLSLLSQEISAMNNAYLVGHLTIKNVEKWGEYRSQVPGTLIPWDAELVFRGNQVEVIAGENLHSSIVVIRFPNIDALNGWYSSPAYQALIPLRLQAAEMALFSYEE
jgi:uncharacterized protein (DUF1330 family)